MRKIAFLAAVAATLCTVACNKELPAKIGNDNIPTEEVKTRELTVAITGDGRMATKSSAADFDDDLSEVNNIQFFVFEQSGVLDAYKKITSGLSTTITIKSGGTSTVWAVVNAPDITNVKTLDELKAVTSTLLDNASSFVMVGYSVGTLPDIDDESKPMEIEVKRIASRVLVKKVTAAFSNPAYAAMSCKLVKMFLINAPGDINLALNSAPSVWYAKQAYESVSGLNGHLSTNCENHELNTSAFDTYCYHYCYPNPTNVDSSSATWSARHTRMVIEVQLGDETFYYPVTMPVLEPGKSYEIENLTITRKGTTNPDSPISLFDANFEVSVKEWTVVPVTSGITI